MDLSLKYPLRELLHRAINGDYTRDQLVELHKLVYFIARRSVHHRILVGKIQLSMIGLREGDLVHDCISEFFRCSEAGELVEVTRYFDYNGVSIGSEDEEELLQHLRILIFSVVSDGIFRILNSADPALGKIIRNMKTALLRSDRWRMSTRFGDKYLALVSPRNSQANPPMPEDILESILMRVMSGEVMIPSILEKMAEELLDTSYYVGPLPLVGFSSMIRDGYEKLCVGDVELSGIDVPGFQEDIQNIVDRCCDQVSRKYGPRYIGGGKVAEHVFAKYILVLKKLMVSEFLSGEKNAESYYEHFRVEFPDVVKAEYMDDHRNILEYLGQYARTQIRNHLKDDWTE